MSIYDRKYHNINLDSMIKTPSESYESLISVLHLLRAISEETYLDAFYGLPGFLMDSEG